MEQPGWLERRFDSLAWRDVPGALPQRITTCISFWRGVGGSFNSDVLLGNTPNILLAFAQSMHFPPWVDLLIS